VSDNSLTNSDDTSNDDSSEDSEDGNAYAKVANEEDTSIINDDLIRGIFAAEYQFIDQINK